MMKMPRLGFARHWLRRSIANRLAAATAMLICLMVLLLGGLAYGNARTLLLGNAADALHGSVRLVANRLTLLLTTTETDVAGLANNSLVVNALLDTGGRRAYLEPFLRDLRPSGKVPSVLSLVDHRGAVLASSSPIPGERHRDAPWLLRLIEDGRPVARLGSGDDAVLLLAYPVNLPGARQPEGALVLELQVRALFADAAGTLDPETTSRLLADDRMLARQGPDAVDADEAALRHVQLLAIDGAAGTLGLTVAATLPRAHAVAGLAPMTRDIVAAGLLALLLASWLAHVGMGRLLRPLLQLGRTADRIRREQRFDLQVPDAAADEIGTMARSFNHMLSGLREARDNLESEVVLRTAALELTRARLDAVQRQLGDALLVVDDTGCIRSYSGAAERLFGRSADEVTGLGVGTLLPGWLRVLSRASVDISTDGRFKTSSTARRDEASFIAEVSASMLVFDKQTQWVVLVRDVTEQRLDAENLQQTNLRLEESVRQLRQHDEDMAQINAMNELLASCQDSAEAHAVIQRVLARLFDGADGALAVVRGDGQLEVTAQWGERAVSRASFALADCWGLRLGRPHHGDRSAVPPCRHGVDAHHALSCLPLTVQGETLGLLSLATDRAATPEARHRVHQLLGMVGEAVKFGLANLRLREALQAAALRDPLTGLHNRRYLEEVAPRELRRALRNGEPLAVAVLDLDHFKRINDRFGHDAGDLVLRELAAVLGSELRASDIVCRFGGEEFVAVLPGSTAIDAVMRMDEVRRAVARHRLRHQDVELPTVTVSIGVSQMPRDGQTLAEVMRAADQALYSAKALGRDRVELAPGPVGSPVIPGLV